MWLSRGYSVSLRRDALLGSITATGGRPWRSLIPRPLLMIPRSLPPPLPLPSPISVRYPLGKLFFLSRRQIIQIDPLQHALLVDALQDLRLHILRIGLRSTQETSQTRLMLDLRFLWIMLAQSRLRQLHLLRRPSARLLRPPQLLRRPRILFPPPSMPCLPLRPPPRHIRICYIRHTHLPHLPHQPLILAVLFLHLHLHRHEHFIPRLVVFRNVFLLRLSLPLVWICAQETL